MVRGGSQTPALESLQGLPDLPISPQGRERLILHLASWIKKCPCPESSLPFAFGSNIYLRKCRVLSLSFYPRGPKESNAPLCWNFLTEIWSSGIPSPPSSLPLTSASTVPPAPGRDSRKEVGWKGGAKVSQAPVTCQAPVPTSLAPRVPALPHARLRLARPSPFQPPATFQWPRGRAS